MNIVFLDFDGVINTPIWIYENDKYKCRYNSLRDGKVNNWQAIQWVSDFCQNFNYSIVISSTWRFDGLEKCTEYLYNGGLRKDIKVIGITPQELTGYRGNEISLWLKEHQNIKNYIIFDDDSDVEPHSDRLVLCRYDVGFMAEEWNKAKVIHDKLNTK